MRSRMKRVPGSSPEQRSVISELPTFAGDGADAGVPTQVLHDYGIGIDCHSQFIQVCVLVRVRKEVVRFEREFRTTWTDLLAAFKWAVDRLAVGKISLPPESVRYTIESTGTYHMPVLLAWRNVPSVVNPTLAGATRRKTDVLDARLLSHHSMCGLWPPSFIPDMLGEELRLLLNMRFEAGRNATRQLNRVNNMVLRFGHTLGAEHSMADTFARAAIEDMCAGKVVPSNLCSPTGIPEDVRSIFMKSYELYDQFAKLRTEYNGKAIKFVKANSWPISGRRIKGGELLDILTSVPGVGEVTALTWLAVVNNPDRFQNAKQVAAFCGSDPSLKVSAGKVTSHVKRKGNARLHHVLKNVAAQLVRRRSEVLGQWGFALHRRHAKGGWARAINAVSRRLSVMLWHCHRLGATFSYEQYQFYVTPEVIDCPVQEMGLGGRYQSMLLDAGLKRSSEVARAFQTSLPQQKGIGSGCLQKVKLWLEGNRVEKPTTSPLESSSMGSLKVAESSPSKVKTANPIALRSSTASGAAKSTSSSRTGSKATNGKLSHKPLASAKKSISKSS
jgi:hypothetical protein